MTAEEKLARARKQLTALRRKVRQLEGALVEANAERQMALFELAAYHKPKVGLWSRFFGVKEKEV